MGMSAAIERMQDWSEGGCRGLGMILGRSEGADWGLRLSCRSFRVRVAVRPHGGDLGDTRSATNLDRGGPIARTSRRRAH